jgi:uncharacterized Rmd1/YagE family protein
MEAAMPTMHAMLLGERIQARGVAAAERISGGWYLLKLEDDALALLFRFGAVVFIDGSSEQRARVLEQIHEHIVEPLATPLEDELALRVDPAGTEGVGDGTVVLRERSVEALFVVGDVLAKSLVLEHYETSIGRAFERIEPLAGRLSRAGRPGPGGKALLRQLGECLTIQHRTVWRVEIEDTPEIAWDRPDLGRLHTALSQEYELRERQRALAHKLDLVARTAETLVGLLQDQRSLRVEWYIVILILVEIALILYPMLA